MRILLPLIVLFNLIWSSCGEVNSADGIDYRQEMRTFVQEISEYGHAQNPDFIVIPQNGHELLIRKGKVAQSYLNSVDGLAQESLFYGYYEDDQPTPAPESSYLQDLLKMGRQNEKTILVTDYCFTSFKVNNSYSQNQQLGFTSFAAPERELTVIPDIPSPLPFQNSNSISRLSQVKNFLYLINPGEYSSKESFISSMESTNYDLIIIDAFFDEQILSSADVNRLRTKDNGGKRLVISYMSIGEAEDYRYYWQPDWYPGSPEFILTENPDWEGNYKVKYWESAWKEVITGNEDSYTYKIINAGFDGVYLDIIDGFEFFE